MSSGARKLLAFSILVGGLGLAWLVRPSGQGFGFAPGGSGGLILRKEAPAAGPSASSVSSYSLLPGLGRDPSAQTNPSGGTSKSHSVGSAGPGVLKSEAPVLPPRFPYPQAEGPSVQPSHQPNSCSVRRHRIVDGDSLEKLAERYLGSPALAAEIYQANRSLLPDPQLLPIGVEIIIPPVTPPQPIPFYQVRQGKLVPLPGVCADNGGSAAPAPSATP